MTNEQRDKAREYLIDQLETMIEDCQEMPEEDWIGEREFYLAAGYACGLMTMGAITDEQREAMFDKFCEAQKAAIDRYCVDERKQEVLDLIEDLFPGVK